MSVNKSMARLQQAKHCHSLASNKLKNLNQLLDLIEVLEKQGQQTEVDKLEEYITENINSAKAYIGTIDGLLMKR